MKSEQGFTLVELLVVVAIVGILAALALPQFRAYKERSYNALALSDVRNVISAEEAYYASNESFVSCGFVYGNSCSEILPGAEVSEGVILEVTSETGAAYQVGGCHTRGTSVYQWEMQSAGLTSNPGIIQTTILPGFCESYIGG